MIFVESGCEIGGRKADGGRGRCDDSFFIRRNFTSLLFTLIE